MPSKMKKKDNVSKNMGARYAPIEGSLRSRAHTLTIDVSGSVSNSAPASLFLPATPSPKFFDPRVTGAASVQASPFQANSSDPKSLFYKKEEHPAVKNENAEQKKPKVEVPTKEDVSQISDDEMDWEPATGSD
uniref:Eukaryotic translation initiation factor 4B n=2 Tax=Caenorhabditis tropicalis TaxID=1561998 RepID=A0A1I7TNH9_9PELO